MKSLITSQRRGAYWEDCQRAIEVLNNMNLQRSDEYERLFEGRISQVLDGMSFNDKFIDQRSTQDVLTRVTLFGSDHRPDMSVGDDGTAIEVKLVHHGSKVKEALSQAIFYRAHYRFVIVILIDITEDGQINKLIDDQETTEAAMVKDFDEYMNIFIVCKLGR